MFPIREKTDLACAPISSIVPAKFYYAPTTSDVLQVRVSSQQRVIKKDIFNPLRRYGGKQPRLANESEQRDVALSQAAAQFPLRKKSSPPEDGDTRSDFYL